MTGQQRSVTLNTGYTMPTIGYGVYQLEGALCPRAVEDALRIGYRHIDCAQFYENETEVGQGLRNSDIPRDQVFITSKIVVSVTGYEETLQSVEESVRKLGSSYYDLFLVHSPHGGRDERLAKYKALLAAKERGLVRTIGVSNFSEKHIREIKGRGVREACREPNRTSPMVSAATDCVVLQVRGDHCAGIHAGNEVAKGKGIKNAVVRRIAAKHGKTPAQVLIRWSLQKGFVPLPKATAAHRIEENLSVYDFGLDAEDVAEIDALDEGARGAVTWNPVGER